MFSTLMWSAGCLHVLHTLRDEKKLGLEKKSPSFRHEVIPSRGNKQREEKKLQRNSLSVCCEPIENNWLILSKHSCVGFQVEKWDGGSLPDSSRGQLWASLCRWARLVRAGLKRSNTKKKRHFSAHNEYNLKWSKSEFKGAKSYNRIHKIIC